MENFKFEQKQTSPEKKEKKKVIQFEKFINKLQDVFRSGNAYAKGEWKKKDFNLEERLSKVKGPFIEVAGPTSGGYDLVDFDKLDKKLHTSNVFPGCPVIDSRRGEKNKTINYLGKVDFMADARELPLKDNSVGAVFASCLGGEHLKDMSVMLGDKKFSDEAHYDDYSELIKDKKKGIVANKEEFEELKKNKKEKDTLRREAMEEAFRVLEDEGVLLWQGGHKEDFDVARELGFEIVQQTEDKEGLRSFDIYHNGVFVKKIKEDEDIEISEVEAA